jgi:hypothetical protein
MKSNLSEATTLVKANESKYYVYLARQGAVKD